MVAIASIIAGTAVGAALTVAGLRVVLRILEPSNGAHGRARESR